MTDADQRKCELCGEPLPEGEESFRYHGYSGPCPKPPLEIPKIGAVIEYLYRSDGSEYWLDIRVDRVPHTTIGPFDTEAARDTAKADLLDMMRSVGATDLGASPQ